MLFTSVAYAHGFITNPIPRKLVGSDPQLAINNGEFYKQSTGATTAPDVPKLVGAKASIKSEADILANLDNLSKAFPGAFPCRYNKEWAPTNNLTAKTKIEWKTSAPHPGTCIIQLLKKGIAVQTLGEPFLCSQQTGGSGFDPNNTGAGANGGSMEIEIPAGTNCAVDDECSIQWFWNADQDDQQYVNCVDFTMSGEGSAGPPQANSTALIKNNATLPPTDVATNSSQGSTYLRRCKSQK